MQLLEEGLLTMEDALVDQPARDAERCALATESLLASGRLRMQVHGASMLPTLWPGDLVEIRSCSVDEVLPGEIVLARRAGRFFLHRFVSRFPNGFALRGDSMPGPDPQFPNEALLGRLVGCRERGSSESKNHPVLPLRSWSWAIGQLFCFFAPARRLALKLHFRRIRNSCEGQIVRVGLAANNLPAINIGAADSGAS
jgi:hypothetical protein